MDVKEALAKAKEYFSDACSGQELYNVLLEEINFDYDSEVWNITFGYAKTAREDGTTGPPTTREELKSRVYKLVRIDDDTGKIEPLQDRFANEWDPRWLS